MARTERAIRERVFPGCAVGTVSSNGKRDVFTSGNFTYEPNSPVVDKDSIYDVASITKSIPTASLALMLIDKGQLELTGKLINYVPEYNSSFREVVTIKHLLTYTVGGPQLSLLKDKTPTEILESVYSYECANKPGSVFSYSNAPALLLGFVVERVGGSSLDKLAQEYFFGPLKMINTAFPPGHNSAIYRTIVPTEVEKQGEVHGIVHDESAQVFARAGKVVGHAGLFSTAPDILNFMEMLLHEGKWNNRRYFSLEVIREMSANQIAELGACTGLGWQLNEGRWMGASAGAHTFGKTGFTGTSCMCDIEKGVALVILSNCTYPTRPKDRSAIDAFRADIADIAFSGEDEIHR